MKKRFKVIFSPPAQREIERLELDSALQIAKDTKTYLEISPLPFGKTRIKKITGFYPPLYRLRSGDFRAYYRIISTDVVVLAITHKKNSEKALKKLKKSSPNH
ncbi:MAG: type II toxin-antitoxin system RelE/ParE family toxin [Proteobacteria bacterium]|nr:type II toxin-antitoxin system RelE/ParE family toxin [Pseudomonadota bacterium]